MGFEVFKDAFQAKPKNFGFLDDINDFEDTSQVEPENFFLNDFNEEIVLAKRSFRSALVGDDDLFGASRSPQEIESDLNLYLNGEEIPIERLLNFSILPERLPPIEITDIIKQRLDSYLDGELTEKDEKILTFILAFQSNLRDEYKNLKETKETLVKYFKKKKEISSIFSQIFGEKK
jgi:hypothetical protein